MATDKLEAMNKELDDLLAMVEGSAPKDFLDEFHRAEADAEEEDDDAGDADDADADAFLRAGTRLDDGDGAARLAFLQRRTAQVDAALRDELHVTDELQVLPMMI